MLRIALCDDDDEELTTTYGMIENWMKDNHITGQVTSFTTGRELINSLEDNAEYDMYILDIIMPEYNGINLGSMIRSLTDNDYDIPLIFITATPGFAVESYDVRAFHYLLKPVAQEKIDQVLSSAFSKLHSEDNNIFPVRTRSGTVSLPYNDICFVELKGRTLHFVCSNDEVGSVTIPGSFKEAVSLLTEDERFYPCGASLVVNLKLIRSIDKNDLIFINGRTTSIPRATRKPLYAAWLDYCLEGGI